MIDDLNYNAKVTFDDSTTALIYANRLHNEEVDNWHGWLCTAGVTSIYIYQDDVYNGECCNDTLGKILDKTWQLIDNHTICQLERCTGCTTDLMQKKQKP